MNQTPTLEELKDDIRSGEVGPNILCRMVDSIVAAAIRKTWEEAAKIADDVSTGCAEMHKRGTSCAEHMAITAQAIAVKIRERIAAKGQE